MDIKRLKEIANQAGDQNDCRLYDFYKHRDRFQILIDKPNESVSLKDCENVFHSLKFLIRSEFPELLEQKRLEVSSPGLDKRLREVWHFKEAIGQNIQIVTISPVQSLPSQEGRVVTTQSIKGVLTSVGDDELQLKESQREWLVPFSKIKTASISFLLPEKGKSVKKGLKQNTKNQTNKKDKR